jgi:DNA-binding MarR family transcriptional regulator
MAQIIDLKLGKTKNEKDLSTLVSFRLRRLTNMYTKASASVYEREFGLTLNEWRVVSLLFASGPMSMSRLAHQALFDRGLTSRVVGALIERGLIARKANPLDGRGVVIELSDKGRGVVDEVAPLAYDRNRQLLACLTNKEAEMLETILDKLTHQARVMLDIEREEALQLHTNMSGASLDQ